MVSSKVVAYLAAHVHEWDYTPLGSGTRQVPQIIAGDAGSPLSGGDQFGFTLVTVYANGKVTAGTLFHQAKAQSAAILPDDLEVILSDRIKESIDSTLWDEAQGEENAERMKVIEATRRWSAP